MFETGIVEHHFATKSRNATYCLAPPGKEFRVKFRVMELEDFQGVFLIFAVGNEAVINFRVFLQFIILLFCKQYYVTFVYNVLERL